MKLTGILLMTFLFLMIGITIFLASAPFNLFQKYTCIITEHNISVCEAKQVSENIYDCNISYENKLIKICSLGSIEDTSFSPFLTEERIPYPEDYGFQVITEKQLSFGIWSFIKKGVKRIVSKVRSVFTPSTQPSSPTVIKGDSNVIGNVEVGVLSPRYTPSSSGSGSSTSGRDRSGRDRYSGYAYYEPKRQVCYCQDKTECYGMPISNSLISGKRFILKQKCLTKSYYCDENPPLVLYYTDCLSTSTGRESWSKTETKGINLDTYTGNVCVYNRCVKYPIEVKILETLNKIGIEA